MGRIVRSNYRGISGPSAGLVQNFSVILDNCEEIGKCVVVKVTTDLFCDEWIITYCETMSLEKLRSELEIVLKYIIDNADSYIEFFIDNLYLHITCNEDNSIKHIGRCFFKKQM